MDDLDYLYENEIKRLKRINKELKQEAQVLVDALREIKYSKSIHHDIELATKILKQWEEGN